MKQKIVGTYPNWGGYIEVVLREGTMAEFYCNPDPDKHKPPRIVIGADSKSWSYTFASLLHEALELTIVQIRCRYELNDDSSGDNGNLMFIMSHTDFSEASHRTAIFLSECLPDFAKAWKEWHKPVKKKEKK